VHPVDVRVDTVDSKDKVDTVDTADTEAGAADTAAIARVSSRKHKVCSRARWTTAIAMVARTSEKAAAAQCPADTLPRNSSPCA